jgi:predicted transcriptional regulator
LKEKKMLTKEKIKSVIDTLPENFTIEDVMEELIIIDKIEQGLKDIKDGNVYTTEEVKQKLSKWLK